MIDTQQGIMVTGTKQGMTEPQFNTFSNIVGGLFEKFGNIFRHGDCIGVDWEAGEIVADSFPEVSIIVHPPKNPKYRAYSNKYSVLLPEDDYLVRDHEMVRRADFTVGFPKDFHEELRSGTWATLRYAKKIKRNHMIIWPDGELQLFEF